MEPRPGRVDGVGDRRQVDRGLDAAQDLLEHCPPLGEGLRHQGAVAEGQQVEGDEGGRRLGGEQLDPGGGGVDPLLEGVELQTAVHHQDDLAVDDAALRQLPLHRLDDVGEVARERALVAAAELDLVAIAEHQRPEAVELRFV